MGIMLRGLQQLGKGIMISDYQGLSKRDNAQGQQVGKGIMIRDHQGLSKRDNAQGPSTDWEGDHDQGPPRVGKEG